MTEHTPQDLNVQVGNEGEDTSEEDAVFFVSLSFKGHKLDVPVQTGDSISQIFDFIEEIPELDFPRENCKLICKGKVFRPDDQVSLVGESRLSPGAKLMLMATSAHDAAFVKSQRADPLVKGFTEEARDERNRKKRAMAATISAWGTKQDFDYRFNSIKAEFKYSSPSPYDAEKLLQKLATDPGIIEIMKTRQFKVGILTEMSPVEAQERMAKKGTPGMDLLGYNQNAGEMIVLRLRTDNTKGFRPYHDLINTLIHELTHNVWGPHDHNFWKFFGELKAQYMKFHRFWSHGGHAADSNATGQFQGFATGNEDDNSSAGFGRVLGGSSSSSAEISAPQTEEDRRERAKLAAEARLVTESSGINFLNSNGKVIMVCPCGQVHDADQCPLSIGVNSQEVVNDKGDDMEVEEISPNQTDSQTLEASADVDMSSPPEVVAHPEVVVETLTSETDQLGEQPLPEKFEKVDEPMLPPLSTEELESLGLGGISVWLQNFTERLTALRDQAGQPARRLKADNPKIRASLLGLGPDAEKLLNLLGFEAIVEDGHRVLVLRDATFDSVRLRMGQELLERELGPSAVGAH
eukprot:CAMPEP_0169413184 /NCGR_PEP_ID=MMETSP1017-20121227/61219_1 /TAXON_ID=342587 /ORGANISM="Karlodinium micrum, Strain CCMP2283" /LENGTH=577 /DNA_ID=CAMNT_0009520579 /DNA_START=51 /DNA_END=1784 /DNA_ORIENTATION=+